MAYARYDPYTDKWIYEDSQTSTVATVSISKEPIRTYQLTELTDECIDKIADAVVQKLRAEQTEPTMNPDLIKFEEEWECIGVVGTDPNRNRNNCTLELFDDYGNYIETPTDCAWK